MTNSQRLATVRSAIANYLQNQARVDDNTDIDPTLVSESILIRDEFYCGRRFRTPSHHAIWFLEEDQLKIYSADNSLCVVLTADEIDVASVETSSMDEDESPNVISIHSQLSDAEPEISHDQRRAA